MSAAVDRQIMQLVFSDEERARVHELAVKNQDGALTPEATSELDNDLRVGSMLSDPQSRRLTGAQNSSSRVLNHSWMESSLASFGLAVKPRQNKTPKLSPRSRSHE